MSKDFPACIYLVPEFSDDEAMVWCADPAPGTGMDPADAVPYIRADFHDRRVTELLHANNREVERRRTYETLAQRLADENMGLRYGTPMRGFRQSTVAAWCAAAFGTDHAASVPQRAVRMLEEAIELYQAAGAEPAMAHKLIDFVFDRPPGDLFQELGGVGLTVLALAEAAHVSADAAEVVEIERVMAKPLEHFKGRNEAKNAAGFEVVATGCQIVEVRS